MKFDKTTWFTRFTSLNDTFITDFYHSRTRFLREICTLFSKTSPSYFEYTGRYVGFQVGSFEIK